MEIQRAVAVDVVAPTSIVSPTALILVVARHAVEVAASVAAGLVRADQRRLASGDRAEALVRHDIVGILVVPRPLKVVPSVESSGSTSRVSFDRNLRSSPG